MTANTPDNTNEPVDRIARVIADALALGLREAERAGAEQAAAEQAAQEGALSPQVVETLERFGDAMTRLAAYTEQLGLRMNELTDAVAKLADSQQPVAAPAAPAPVPQIPQLEPSFAPGGEGIDVTIAAVPGFQGLMDLQRALVRLPQVQSAAVRRYQDDEAAIQLVLAQPMSAAAIIEGVTAATGRQIMIDEARPETLRLRLRFLA
jgi:hypothetical protein